MSCAGLEDTNRPRSHVVFGKCITPGNQSPLVSEPTRLDSTDDRWSGAAGCQAVRGVVGREDVLRASAIMNATEGRAERGGRPRRGRKKKPPASGRGLFNFGAGGIDARDRVVSPRGRWTSSGLGIRSRRAAPSGLAAFQGPGSGSRKVDRHGPGRDNPGRRPCFRRHLDHQRGACRRGAADRGDQCQAVRALPILPTIAESGVPGFETEEMQGIVAPAGTPPDIIAKLNAEIGRILQLPEIRDQLTNLGATPQPGTPGDFSNYLHAEVDKWRYVFKDATPSVKE